jgi:hypothetical protein
MAPQNRDDSDNPFSRSSDDSGTYVGDLSEHLIVQYDGSITKIDTCSEPSTAEQDRVLRWNWMLDQHLQLGEIFWHDFLFQIYGMYP